MSPIRSPRRPGVRLRRALLAMGLLLAPVALRAASAEPWERAESGHATIRYRAPDRGKAEGILRDVEEAVARIAPVLGVDPGSGIAIYLADSAETFRDLTAGAVPDWGAGCAIPARRTIVLRDLPGAPRPLPETTRHEVSHVLLRGAAGNGSVPVWFDEGVAMRNASEWGWGQSWEMAVATAWGSLIPLREVEEVLTFGSPKARLAYAQSFFAVEHLLNRSGPGSLPRLLARMRSGEEFEEAFFGVFGLTPAAFEADWRNAVGRRFGLASLLFDSLGFWLGVTLLFLAAYVATRLRTRRKLRRWEAEEEGPVRPILSVHPGRTGLDRPDHGEGRVAHRTYGGGGEIRGRGPVIGVTGGLGAGKSSVCRRFEARGALVLDADLAGREAVQDPEVLARLVSAFGVDILDDEGRLDRRLLGRRAFADESSRGRLNGIVWPPLVRRLRADVEEALRERPDRPVVVDAALLVEWGDLSWLDALVVVTAPEPIRKARMMARMGLSEAEVESRMRAQLPEAEKARRADYVIPNDGSEEDLRERADEVWRRVTGTQDEETA